MAATIDLVSEVTERVRKLLPEEAVGRVGVILGKRASPGVRVDGTERILEVDTVLTSSVMRTKQRQ